jgi:predicted pyridoxine 5'-phosphate oxidase superfamily flavin-nucleotide-binding protein
MNDHTKRDSVFSGSSAEQLAQHKLGTTKRARAFYQAQWVDQLNEEMQGFIQRQEMVFIATADEHGKPDCSLRAGTAGFVHVLDSKRLAYPEYRGNGVMASVGNMLSNPHIGMMFVDFFQSTVGLHVNGKARFCRK